MSDTDHTLAENVEVSVIIPVKEIDGFIDDCLESLRNQDYSACFEVIFVQGGNIPKAKNKGIEIARGRLLAFIDSDCIATKTWLSTLTKTLLQTDKAGGIGGPGISPPSESDFSKAIDCVYESYLGSLGSSSLMPPKKVTEIGSLSTHSCIYHKSVLSSVAGFDERYNMNEDTDLSNRVTEKGYRLFITPEAVVYHKRKKNFKAFFKKFYQYGVSRMRAILTDRRNIDPRILVLLGLFLGSVILTFSYISLAITLGAVYLTLITLHGFYYTLRDKKIVYLLFIPFLYFFEHFGYALGLLVGVIRGKYNADKRPEDIQFVIKRFP